MPFPLEPFGPRLRALRLAAGLSLSELARRVHYSKGHVSRIENGVQPPSADFARLCDATLSADGELVRMVSAPPRRGTGADADDEDDGIWVMTMTPDGASSFAALRRRDVLLAGTASLVGLGAAPARTAAAQAEFGVAGHRQAFTAIRALGQVTAPGQVLPMVVAQLNALRGLAPHTRGRAGADLAMLAAHTAEYAGWMAQEAGDDGSAMRWTRRAVRFATEAGDRHLATYALVRQALVSLYQEDGRTTVALAQAAQAVPGTPPRILALAAQREAQGHALVGERGDCLRALERAAGHLAAVEADSERPVLGTAHVQDPVAIVAGWCLHDLGRPAEAAEVLTREVARIPPTAVRARVRFGVRQALAYAAAGEVAQACAVAKDLVTLALTIDSATIRADVRKLATTLRRWPANPDVRALEPAMTTTLYRGAY